jgi:hypothetical protein
MNNINTYPIEDFLNKARLAIKSNQKTLTLSIKEVSDLQNSLSIVMTRLAGENNPNNLGENVVIKVDGGSFF